MRRAGPLVVLAALVAGGAARADVADAGAQARVSGCVEIIPQGAARPEVTEVLPDPHYQSLARVRAPAAAARFREREVHRGRLAFTATFVRPAAGAT